MDLSNYMRNKMNIHDNVNSDNEEENVRGGQYRHKKFYAVPNGIDSDVLDLRRSGSSTPREMWRPRQPAFAPQPAFVPQQPAFVQQQAFVPQQVAQPPPMDLNVNSFFLANMPQQRHVPRSVMTPGQPLEQHHQLPPVPDFCK